MEGSLTIGEVARSAGINASAIRFYERTGILPVPARVGGKRRYEPQVLQRLSVIEVGKRAGFSLDEVRVLLEATDAGAPAHARLRELAASRLPRIDALITDAQEVRNWLAAADGCTCDTLDECSLFDAATPSDAPCSTA